MGDAANDQQGEEGKQENPVRKRQRSQLAFPYTDLHRAIELSEKLAELGGRSQVELTQLAAALNQTADGGTFRGRMSAARIFGLAETTGDTAQLTDLGEAVLDQRTAAAAKVSAFLRVPLYEKLYSEYQGYALPQAAAIQRKMVMLGLPQKQVERARQVFASSVEAAGFINPNGRFIKPIVAARADPGEDDREDQFEDEVDEDNTAREDIEKRRKRGGGGGGGSGGNGGSEYHPLIQGMIDRLPKVDEPFSESDRKAWLTMAEAIFAVIYTKGSDVNRAKADTNAADDLA